ncbi:ABC transporter permease [Mesorhizobium sp. ES1-6]|uniref:ABC transporter permease n=1 Tax=Mesorhizobium sp. ES1-6 TaxID=2876626 RepID=UPI001CCBA897|nr:ABC transporter permease [Mesorhizobium sp. ES1-6]MBZ9801121.1 ABC transporter permease [Mesorhizobium sp. ES1-6]
MSHSALSHAAGITTRIRHFVASAWQSALHRPEAPSAAFLVLLVVVLSVATPGFLSAANLRGIVEQVAVVSIVALAVNQVILAGEIDVSTGSVVAVCAFVYGNIADLSGGSLVPLLGALATGLLLGLINGAVSTYGRVPSIITTLGALFVYRGLVLLLAGAQVLNLAAGSRDFGQGSLLAIPVAILVLIGLCLAMDILARHTTLGRNVYAVGGNPRAARMIGLPVNLVRTSTFALTGLCCGLAASVMIGQIGQLQATAATGLELKVVAAVVLGGTSIAGGKGSTFAPVVGALLVGVILNAMTLNRVPGTFELLVLGALILLAVSVEGIRLRFQGRRPVE